MNKFVLVHDSSLSWWPLGLGELAGGGALSTLDQPVLETLQVGESFHLLEDNASHLHGDKGDGLGTLLDLALCTSSSDCSFLSFITDQ